MKTKHPLPVFYLLLSTEGLALLFFSLQKSTDGGTFPALLRFPWVPLARLLRIVSLSGPGGNLFAWVLYLLLCLAPAVGFFFLVHRHRFLRADLLLPLWSVAALPVLYLLINPTLLARRFPLGFDFDTASIFYSSLLWGIPLAWGILRFLVAAPASQLHRKIQHLLCAADVILVAQAFGGNTLALRDALRTISASNTALTAKQLLPTRIFCFLRYTGELLPYLMALCIVHRLLQLLAAAEHTRYSQTVITSAAQLSSFCRTAVQLTFAIQLLLFTAQLTFSPLLYDIQLRWSVPLEALGLSLGSLLLSQWLAEGKALKDENEGFI